MTHTLESEDTPPPMPSSWRLFGSGEPMTERKIGSHASREAGRSRAWKMTALDVPPRMNTAGSFFCGMGHLPVCPGIGPSAAGGPPELAHELVFPSRAQVSGPGFGPDLGRDLEQTEPVHEVGVNHDGGGRQSKAQAGIADDALDLCLCADVIAAMEQEASTL